MSSYNNFYVYRHIRLDTNTPFYVGKGKDNRAYSSKNRNKYWKHITTSTKYEVEIILTGLSETESFKKEREFIKLYKGFGYCEANFTDGGEGCSGFRPSKESIKKSALKRTGLKQSKETIAKRIEKLKGRKLTESQKAHLRKINTKYKTQSQKEERKEYWKLYNRLKMREKRKYNKRLTKEEKSLLYRNSAKNKPVVRSDGKEYVSVRAAARETNCGHSEICRAIKRNIKAQGFNWSYKTIISHPKN